ncbi:MAG TPA: poly(R)-hydroxyalkanoic acid synthase subunit PhaE [Bryobacteraceae bacterium]|nr:poly(R)-hydroxyalkanoic acid synthase subunit PhaE [Bryobacteraceae bacterium]
MSSDPWQQWRAFSALFTPGAAAAAPGRGGPASFAPFTETAERFAAAARAYMDATKALAAAPADATRMFTDSLRELFADFQPWNAGMGTGPGGAPSGFTTNTAALGAAREHQQRGERMAEAWRRFEDAQRRLQRLGSDMLRDAAAHLASRLGTSAPVDNPEALRKLYDAWIDCAEEAYGRTAHSEAFCNALAESVNASADWRRELLASMEHSAKFLDLPTRSEVNTVLQRVKTLEEEVRVLRKAAEPKAAEPKAAEPKAAARKARPARPKAKR